MGRVRVRDVWDAERLEVRPQVTFHEKNSQLRTITPIPDLRAALREYVLKEHDQTSEYLFPGARRPGCPAPFGIRNVLGSVCHRAGLPRFTPHQFLLGCIKQRVHAPRHRHYVVNTLMQRGNRLETVSKWLGHRNPVVTYRIQLSAHTGG